MVAYKIRQSGNADNKIFLTYRNALNYIDTKIDGIKTVIIRKDARSNEETVVENYASYAKVAVPRGKEVFKFLGNNEDYYIVEAITIYE